MSEQISDAVIERRIRSQDKFSREWKKLTPTAPAAPGARTPEEVRPIGVTTPQVKPSRIIQEDRIATTVVDAEPLPEITQPPSDVGPQPVDPVTARDDWYLEDITPLEEVDPLQLAKDLAAVQETPSHGGLNWYSPVFKMVEGSRVNRPDHAAFMILSIIHARSAGDPGYQYGDATGLFGLSQKEKQRFEAELQKQGSLEPGTVLLQQQWEKFLADPVLQLTYYAPKILTYYHRGVASGLTEGDLVEFIGRRLEPSGTTALPAGAYHKAFDEIYKLAVEVVWERAPDGLPDSIRRTPFADGKDIMGKPTGLPDYRAGVLDPETDRLGLDPQTGKKLEVSLLNPETETPYGTFEVAPEKSGWEKFSDKFLRTAWAIPKQWIGIQYNASPLSRLGVEKGAYSLDRMFSIVGTAYEFGKALATVAGTIAWNVIPLGPALKASRERGAPATVADLANIENRMGAGVQNTASPNFWLHWGSNWTDGWKAARQAVERGVEIIIPSYPGQEPEESYTFKKGSDLQEFWDINYGEFSRRSRLGEEWYKRKLEEYRKAKEDDEQDRFHIPEPLLVGGATALTIGTGGIGGALLAAATTSGVVSRGVDIEWDKRSWQEQLGVFQGPRDPKDRHTAAHSQHQLNALKTLFVAGADEWDDEEIERRWNEARDFSYTWLFNTNAEENYLNDRSFVEKQINDKRAIAELAPRRLTWDEIDRLKKVHEDPFTEMLGELIFDLFNLVPGKVFEKGWGLLSMPVRKAGSVVWNQALKVDKFASYFSEAVRFTGRKFGASATETLEDITRAISDDFVEDFQKVHPDSTKKVYTRDEWINAQTNKDPVAFAIKAVTGSGQIIHPGTGMVIDLAKTQFGKDLHRHLHVLGLGQNVPIPGRWWVPQATTTGPIADAKRAVDKVITNLESGKSIRAAYERTVRRGITTRFKRALEIFKYTDEVAENKDVVKYFLNQLDEKTQEVIRRTGEDVWAELSIDERTSRILDKARGELFTPEFLRRHGISQQGFYYDLDGNIVKTKDDKHWLSAGALWFKKLWIEANLSARPGFTVRNVIDSSFRAMTGGGLFVFTGSLKNIIGRTPFSKEALATFGQLEASAAVNKFFGREKRLPKPWKIKHWIEALQDVSDEAAKRILNNEEQGRSAMEGLVWPLGRKLTKPGSRPFTLNLASSMEVMRDWNEAFEVMARMRVYDKVYQKTYKDLNHWYSQNVVRSYGEKLGAGGAQLLKKLLGKNDEYIKDPQKLIYFLDRVFKEQGLQQDLFVPQALKEYLEAPVDLQLFWDKQYVMDIQGNIEKEIFETWQNKGYLDPKEVQGIFDKYDTAIRQKIKSMLQQAKDDPSRNARRGGREAGLPPSDPPPTITPGGARTLTEEEKLTTPAVESTGAPPEAIVELDDAADISIPAASIELDYQLNDSKLSFDFSRLPDDIARKAGIEDQYNLNRIKSTAERFNGFVRGWFERFPSPQSDGGLSGLTKDKVRLERLEDHVESTFRTYSRIRKGNTWIDVYGPRTIAEDVGRTDRWHYRMSVSEVSLHRLNTRLQEIGERLEKAGVRSLKAQQAAKKELNDLLTTTGWLDTISDGWGTLGNTMYGNTDRTIYQEIVRLAQGEGSQGEKYRNALMASGVTPKNVQALQRGEEVKELMDQLAYIQFYGYKKPDMAGVLQLTATKKDARTITHAGILEFQLQVNPNELVGVEGAQRIRHMRSLAALTSGVAEFDDGWNYIGGGMQAVTRGDTHPSYYSGLPPVNASEEEIVQAITRHTKNADRYSDDVKIGTYQNNEEIIPNESINSARQEREGIIPTTKQSVEEITQHILDPQGETTFIQDFWSKPAEALDDKDLYQRIVWREEQQSWPQLKGKPQDFAETELVKFQEDMRELSLREAKKQRLKAIEGIPAHQRGFAFRQLLEDPATDSALQALNLEVLNVKGEALTNIATYSERLVPKVTWSQYLSDPNVNRIPVSVPLQTKHKTKILPLLTKEVSEWEVDKIAKYTYDTLEELAILTGTPYQPELLRRGRGKGIPGLLSREELVDRIIAYQRLDELLKVEQPTLFPWWEAGERIPVEEFVGPYREVFSILYPYSTTQLDDPSIFRILMSEWKAKVEKEYINRNLSDYLDIATRALNDDTIRAGISKKVLRSFIEAEQIAIQRWGSKASRGFDPLSTARPMHYKEVFDKLGLQNIDLLTLEDVTVLIDKKGKPLWSEYRDKNEAIFQFLEVDKALDKLDALSKSAFLEGHTSGNALRFKILETRELGIPLYTIVSKTVVGEPYHLPFPDFIAWFLSNATKEMASKYGFDLLSPPAPVELLSRLSARSRGIPLAQITRGLSVKESDVAHKLKAVYKQVIEDALNSFQIIPEQFITDVGLEKVAEDLRYQNLVALQERTVVNQARNPIKYDLGEGRKAVKYTTLKEWHEITEKMVDDLFAPGAEKGGKGKVDILTLKDGVFVYPRHIDMLNSIDLALINTADETTLKKTRQLIQKIRGQTKNHWKANAAKLREEALAISDAVDSAERILKADKWDELDEQMRLLSVNIDSKIHSTDPSYSYNIEALTKKYEDLLATPGSVLTDDIQDGQVLRSERKPGATPRAMVERPDFQQLENVIEQLAENAKTSIDDHFAYTFALLLSQTPKRFSSTLELIWRNVDLDAGQIWLVDKRLPKAKWKNFAPEAGEIVDLEDDVIKALEQWKKRLQDKGYELADDDKVWRDWKFSATEEKKFLGSNRVQTILTGKDSVVKKVFEDTDIRFQLHDFRRYYAGKLWRDSGGDLALVQKYMRHKKLKDTITYLQAIKISPEEIGHQLSLLKNETLLKRGMPGLEEALEQLPIRLDDLSQANFMPLIATPNPRRVKEVNQVWNQLIKENLELKEINTKLLKDTAISKRFFEEVARRSVNTSMDRITLKALVDKFNRSYIDWFTHYSATHSSNVAVAINEVKVKKELLEQLITKLSETSGPLVPLKTPKEYARHGPPTQTFYKVVNGKGDFVGAAYHKPEFAEEAARQANILQDSTDMGYAEFEIDRWEDWPKLLGEDFGNWRRLKWLNHQPKIIEQYPELVEAMQNRYIIGGPRGHKLGLEEFDPFAEGPLSWDTYMTEIEMASADGTGRLLPTPAKELRPIHVPRPDNIEEYSKHSSKWAQRVQEEKPVTDALPLVRIDNKDQPVILLAPNRGYTLVDKARYKLPTRKFEAGHIAGYEGIEIKWKHPEKGRGDYVLTKEIHFQTLEDIPVVTWDTSRLKGGDSTVFDGSTGYRTYYALADLDTLQPGYVYQTTGTQPPYRTEMVPNPDVPYYLRSEVPNSSVSDDFRIELLETNAKLLNPHILLTQSEKLGRGIPIITPEGYVIDGSGRINMLRMAANKLDAQVTKEGVAFPNEDLAHSWNKYSDLLKERIESFGFTTDKVDNLFQRSQNPRFVLVQVLADDLDKHHVARAIRRANQPRFNKGVEHLKQFHQETLEQINEVLDTLGNNVKAIDAKWADIDIPDLDKIVKQLDKGNLDFTIDRVSHALLVDLAGEGEDAYKRAHRLADLLLRDNDEYIHLLIRGVLDNYIPFKQLLTKVDKSKIKLGQDLLGNIIDVAELFAKIRVLYPEVIPEVMIESLISQRSGPYSTILRGQPIAAELARVVARSAGQLDQPIKKIFTKYIDDIIRSTQPKPEELFRHAIREHGPNPTFWELSGERIKAIESGTPDFLGHRQLQVTPKSGELEEAGPRPRGRIATEVRGEEAPPQQALTRIYSTGRPGEQIGLAIGLEGASLKDTILYQAARLGKTLPLPSDPLVRIKLLEGKLSFYNLIQKTGTGERAGELFQNVSRRELAQKAISPEEYLQEMTQQLENSILEDIVLAGNEDLWQILETAGYGPTRPWKSLDELVSHEKGMEVWKEALRRWYSSLLEKPLLPGEQNILHTLQHKITKDEALTAFYNSVEGTLSYPSLMSFWETIDRLLLEENVLRNPVAPSLPSYKNWLPEKAIWEYTPEGIALREQLGAHLATNPESLVSGTYQVAEHLEPEKLNMLSRQLMWINSILKGGVWKTIGEGSQWAPQRVGDTIRPSLPLGEIKTQQALVNWQLDLIQKEVDGVGTGKFLTTENINQILNAPVGGTAADLEELTVFHIADIIEHSITFTPKTFPKTISIAELGNVYKINTTQELVEAINTSIREARAQLEPLLENISHDVRIFRKAPVQYTVDTPIPNKLLDALRESRAEAMTKREGFQARITKPVEIKGGSGKAWDPTQPHLNNPLFSGEGWPDYTDEELEFVFSKYENRLLDMTKKWRTIINAGGEGATGMKLGEGSTIKIIDPPSYAENLGYKLGRGDWAGLQPWKTRPPVEREVGLEMTRQQRDELYNLIRHRVIPERNMIKQAAMHGTLAPADIIEPMVGTLGRPDVAIHVWDDLVDGVWTNIKREWMESSDNIYRDKELLIEKVRKDLDSIIDTIMAEQQAQWAEHIRLSGLQETQVRDQIQDRLEQWIQSETREPVMQDWWRKSQGGVVGEGPRVATREGLPLARAMREQPTTEEIYRLAPQYFGSSLDPNTSIEGATKAMGRIMVDYSSQTNFDQMMKIMFPFWVFPTRSLMFWANTLAAKPKILATYAKLQAASDRLSYDVGAVASRGRPLARFKGHLKLGGTNWWINPLSPLSFTQIIPDWRSYSYEAQDEDVAPMQKLVTFLMAYGPPVGFHLAPWFSVPLSSSAMGLINEEDFPKRSLFGQMDLVPEWSQRFVIGKINKILGTMINDDARKPWTPEVSWKDFLVQRNLLANITQEYKNLDDFDRKQIVLEAEAAIATRSGPRWDAARDELEQSEYFGRIAGYLTGIYAKQFHKGEAELYKIRDEIAALRRQIATDAAYEAFWTEWRYNSPEGLTYGAYTLISHVTDEEGKQLFGEERANQIKEELASSQAYSGKLSAMFTARRISDIRRAEFPIGTPSAAKNDIWKEYSSSMTAINKRFPDVDQNWKYYNKNDDTIREHIKDKWMHMLSQTRPIWEPGATTWDEHELAVLEWELNELPNVGAELIVGLFTELAQEEIYFDKENEETGEITNKFADLYDTVQKGKAFLLAMATGEKYNEWDIGNDDLYDAMNRVWRDNYYGAFWDYVGDSSGSLRTVKERTFKEQFPGGPSDEHLLGWLRDVEVYKEKFDSGEWTDESVLLHRYQDMEDDTPIRGLEIDEIIESGNTPRENEANEIYMWYGWAGPKGARSKLRKAIARLNPDMAEAINDFFASDRAKAGDRGAWKYWSDEFWEQFFTTVSTAVQELHLDEPTDAEVYEWAKAEQLNEAFKQYRAGYYGHDWESLERRYFAMNASDRVDWRNENPEAYDALQGGWDLEEFYGIDNPVWQKYYDPDEYEGPDALTTTSTTSSGGNTAGVSTFGTSGGKTYQYAVGPGWLRRDYKGVSITDLTKTPAATGPSPWPTVTISSKALEQVISGKMSKSTKEYLKALQARVSPYTTWEDFLARMYDLGKAKFGEGAISEQEPWAWEEGYEGPISIELQEDTV